MGFFGAGGASNKILKKRGEEEKERKERRGGEKERKREKGGEKRTIDKIRWLFRYVYPLAFCCCYCGADMSQNQYHCVRVGKRTSCCSKV